MTLELSGESTSGFTNLYRSWRDFVGREALHICQNVADADDVVQTVFARLWASGAMDEIERPRAYFRSAARREALRVGSGPTPLPDDLEIVDPSPGPLMMAIASETDAAIREALESLPTRCGEVMSLTILDEYSAAEIAEECDMSPAAVGKQRTRGWRLLRAWFGPRGGVHLAAVVALLTACDSPPDRGPEMGEASSSQAVSAAAFGAYASPCLALEASGLGEASTCAADTWCGWPHLRRPTRCWP